MSQIQKKNNGKWQTVADLENAYIEMENNLENMNKDFINGMLKTLTSIMVTVQHNEAGIFKVILKWFHLYLKVQILIHPDNKKLLKFYESSVPTIITYIIGCLQYKTKEVPNYHYNLLGILEELLENVQPKILNEVRKFEIGTIGCLWSPIDIAGDFNTQSKALQILTILLKQFDEVRQNEELRCIKWINLNLFQDKLKTVVQETKLAHVQENSTRELLNNYNMNLSKNILVYSFYCTSAVLDNKYAFYKPLNIQKFWIDINYSPKTLSYRARFKLNSKTKYENINVILKVQSMKLHNNILLVYFKAPGEFSNYSKYLVNVTNNVVEFTLTNEEVQRLRDNNYVMEYFNNLSKEDQNIFDSLKNEMSKNLQGKTKTCKSSNLFHINSTPEQNINPENTTTSLKSVLSNNISHDLVESPKTSRNVTNEMDKHPIRKLRDRKKFFTTLLTEDTDEEMVNKKARRKRTKNRKSRQTKSHSKQVCKVTPTVDLTKIENMESIKQSIVKTTSKEELQKTTQDCAEILKQIADIYNVGDTTYAKPCQSYRNFKIQPNPVSQITNVKGSTKARNRKKKVDKIYNESSAEKIRKLTNCYDQENKENINPQTPAISSKIPLLTKSKSIVSPHLFETQCSVETPPAKKLAKATKSYQNLDDVKNSQIDLTLDEIVKISGFSKPKQSNDINNENISRCDSIECEEVRGINENPLKELEYICTPTKSILFNNSEENTPRPTSCMNISDVHDSDIEITQVSNNLNCIMGIMDVTDHQEHNVTVPTNELDMDITHISNDCNYKTINGSAERDYYRDCVIFQKRIDEDKESGSSEDDGNFHEFIHNQKNHQINITKFTPDKNRISTNLSTTMATKCQITPTAIIMHQIQVSAKKSVILRNKNPRKAKKANKSLNSCFQNMNSNKELIELRKEAVAVKNQNSNTSHEKRRSDNVIDHKSPSNNKQIKPNLPIPLHNQLSKLMNINCNFNSAINATLYETPPTNPAIQSQRNYDFEEISEQQSSPCTSNTAEESEHNLFNRNHDSLSKFIRSPLAENSFKSDLLQILNDFNTNMQIRLNSAHRLCLKNVTVLYNQQFCEIAQGVLKKSEEQRVELEEMCSKIGRLVRELEWQYDKFINKSKQFDVHKEITERVLESISNANIPNSITKDYEELIKQLNIEQNKVVQKVWQKYLEKHKN